jgi:hypothetical protein
MRKMIDQELVCKVNLLKEKYPCSTERIDSTPLHNKNVGGKENSYHVKTLTHNACAIDLSFDNVEDLVPAAIYAKDLGFNGIEVDLRNYHLHLDLREIPWQVVVTKQSTIPLADYLKKPITL